MDARRYRDCILCGKCLDVCPLFGVTGREEMTPKAKHFLLQSLDGTLDEEAARKLAVKCLGCGRCEAACPQELSVPERLRELRAASPDWRSWVFRQWIMGASRLWPLAGALAGALHGPARRVLPGGMVLAAEAAASLAAVPSREPWARLDAPVDAGQGKRPKVALFPGCVARYAQRSWLSKAEALLDALGFDQAPWDGFACCGGALGSAGIVRVERELMLRNIEVWRSLDRPRVAVLCASCGHSLRAYPDRLPEMEPGEAKAWREALVPLSGLTAGARFALLENAPVEVGYHRPCHIGERDLDYEFLLRVAGDRVRLPERKNGCCGFGGVLQVTAPGLSREVANACWTRYNATDALQVVTGCSGCVAQLRSSAPPGAAASHWLEIVK